MFQVGFNNSTVFISVASRLLSKNPVPVGPVVHETGYND